MGVNDLRNQAAAGHRHSDKIHTPVGASQVQGTLRQGVVPGAQGPMKGYWMKPLLGTAMGRKVHPLARLNLSATLCGRAPMSVLVQTDEAMASLS